jgi:putative tributyrin esterase
MVDVAGAPAPRDCNRTLPHVRPPLLLHGLLIFAQLIVTKVPGQRGRVENFKIHSKALGVEKQITVYLPPSYDAGRARYPTIYYLHGSAGNERTWVDRLHLDDVADSLAREKLPEAVLVMPDGDASFWTNWEQPDAFASTCSTDTLLVLYKEKPSAFCVAHGRYETYVATEVVPAIDGRYRTVRDARHRALAGYSMGGYGAVILALRHPDIWTAAVSHSGPLEPLYVGPHPFNAHPQYGATVAEIVAQWAPERRPLLVMEFGTDTATWWARDPLRTIERLTSAGAFVPHLYFDVGGADPFADQSRALADTLQQLGVTHTFAEWPGTHDAAYWAAHEGEGLAWLLRYFGRAPQ